MAKVIGLTGPAASGKNEAAKILKQRGAFIIDADKLAHALYEKDLPLWHKLVKAFGSRILSRGGRVDRRKLGEVVFADKRQLRKLNRIVHPYLKRAIVGEIKKAKARGPRPKAKGLIIVNAAVLKEIGLVSCVDEVWVVMAARGKRLRRLLKKGITKKAANSRLRSQMSQKDYLKLADVVVRNNGTLREFKKQVLTLLER